jgi:hypothetical protein
MRGLFTRIQMVKAAMGESFPNYASASTDSLMDKVSEIVGERISLARLESMGEYDELFLLLKAIVMNKKLSEFDEMGFSK